MNRLEPNLSSILVGAFFRVFHRHAKQLDNILANSLYKEAIGIKDMKRVDVFHVHGFWQLLYPKIGAMLSQRFHRSFLMSLHGDSTSPDDPFVMPIRSPTTLDILRQAGAITIFSGETLNILKELGLGDRSWLIPNFIDTQMFRRPTNKQGSGTKLVMISRLNKPKDPITPIKAFAQVIKEFPEATFKIVGYVPL